MTLRHRPLYHIDRGRRRDYPLFPSTNGEGSLIFKGAYRSRRSRLPFCDIKTSLRLLNFAGCGTLDLGEIYQFGPWKRFAFDFRQHPFARNRSHYTPGATPLRICILGNFQHRVCLRYVSTTKAAERSILVRSISSAPGYASPSTFGGTLLYVTAAIHSRGDGLTHMDLG